MNLIQYNRYQESLGDQQSKGKPSSLNVFDYVSQLRYQRYMAVDSVAHYILIYRACLEYVKFGLDDLNDDYGEQLKLNPADFYANRRLSYMVTNPNDIVASNYHQLITQSAGNGILPEFDV